MSSEATAAAPAPTNTIDVSGAVAVPAEDALTTLLGELLPPTLDTLYVVGSASEANDLALRIARYATGGKGVVATRRARHGTTVETAAISPADGGLAAVAGWVRLVDAPDGDGSAFAAAVRSAAFELRDSEYGLAGMIVDPTFRSDGVHSSAGFAEAADAVHDAGGLFIVDETGLTPGSVGPAIWAFSHTGVTPDIHTFIAAPAGTLALAVVASSSSLDSNPVIDPRVFRGTEATRADAEKSLSGIRALGAAGGASKGAADPVADTSVVSGSSSGLASASASGAASVGNYLVAGLTLIASVGTAINSVRGRGLLIGFDSEQSGDLVNALADSGVIVGRAGPATLLIEAPLGFTIADADTLLQRMYAAVLSLDASPSTSAQ